MALWLLSNHYNQQPIVFQKLKSTLAEMQSMREAGYQKIKYSPHLKQFGIPHFYRK